jgi:hypothetical protein
MPPGYNTCSNSSSSSSSSSEMPLGCNSNGSSQHQQGLTQLGSQPQLSTHLYVAYLPQQRVLLQQQALEALAL